MQSAIVSDEQAERNAKLFLRKVPDAAISRLQDSLEHGTFDGNLPQTCFFGHLAAGTGYDFSNQVEPSRTLEQFLRSLGVRRLAREFEPIEFYCLGILPGMTILESGRARHIHSWCDEILNERQSARASGQMKALLFLEERELANV